MALTPQQKLTTTSILNNSETIQQQIYTSKSTTSLTLNNSFKPKAIPPSLNRIPGRASTSPKSVNSDIQTTSSSRLSTPRSLQEEQLDSQQFSLQEQHSQTTPQHQLQQQQPQIPQQQFLSPLLPPTQPQSQQSQRVEDIIRSKLPLARKNSKLLNTQKSTDSISEERTETIENKKNIFEDDQSPVSNTYIDIYSPVVGNDQV